MVKCVLSSCSTVFQKPKDEFNFRKIQLLGSLKSTVWLTLYFYGTVLG